MRTSTISVFAAVALFSTSVSADAWKPSPGHDQLSLWQGKVPDAETVPGPETSEISKDLVAGKPMVWVTNVTEPTLTVYAPRGKNTGVAIVVFPGGGFEGLAMDLEGTEVCDWLTSKGVTCVLLKYRVPSLPYDWHTNSRPHNLQIPKLSLEDAQRAIRLVRYHAAEWGIDPHKTGVLGFSAGGFLVAEISTQYQRRLYAPIDAADKESCRPDFAVGIYPGHLMVNGTRYELNPNVPVTKQTPPTFLLQAEDDNVDGVNQSLVYYLALKKAGVSVEMHLYTHGGHAFGLRHTENPITDWPQLVDKWMHTLGAISE